MPRTEGEAGLQTTLQGGLKTALYVGDGLRSANPRWCQ